MADESNSKEDIPIRHHLVDTAVGFLLNPNVKERPDDAKIAFLKNKGLTDSEIVEAFNKVKYEVGTAFVSNENKQLVNAYPLPHYQTPNSFWLQLRSYSSAFVSLATAVYALHHLYKSYIEPWLFGSKSEKSELSSLKEHLIELNNSVSQLTSTVSSLEEAVNNQMHQIDRSSLYGVESVPKSVRDILEEVSNVKGLLLNRFSFPAPPPIAGASAENKTQNGDSKVPPKVVTIPKWQLRDSESKMDPKEQIEDIENSSSESTSSENSSVDDQKNEAEIAKDKVPGEESSEGKNGDSKECLENNLNVKDEDSKIAVPNEVKNTEEKALNDDSGIESHHYLSDSESIDLTSGPNKHQESAKNSE